VADLDIAALRQKSADTFCEGTGVLGTFFAHLLGDYRVRALTDASACPYRSRRYREIAVGSGNLVRPGFCFGAVHSSIANDHRIDAVERQALAVSHWLPSGRSPTDRRRRGF
jgi:hypothetical protein